MSNLSWRLWRPKAHTTRVFVLPNYQKKADFADDRIEFNGRGRDIAPTLKIKVGMDRYGSSPLVFVFTDQSCGLVG